MQKLMGHYTDLQRLLLACERLGLDPLGGEAYLSHPPHTPLTPSQVVVALGGWLRLLNEHPSVCGIEFDEGPEASNSSGLPAWASCTIHRRDRLLPTTVREYMDECRGATGPWITHPRRMLRHSALVQCARIALGLAAGASAVEVPEASATSEPNPSVSRRKSKSPVDPQELAIMIRGELPRSATQGEPLTALSN